MLDANEVTSDSNLEMTMDDDDNETGNGKKQSPQGTFERIKKHMSLQVKFSYTTIIVYYRVKHVCLVKFSYPATIDLYTGFKRFLFITVHIRSIYDAKVMFSAFLSFW